MTSPNSELLKRPRVWGSMVVVLVLALGWWFAWMSPEGAKLASVRAEQARQQQTEVSLTSELTMLRADATRVRLASPFLARFGRAIPALPDAPSIVEQVYQLAVQDNVTLQSITDDSVVSAGLGYSTIPVSMSVAGGHDALLAFVAGLYQLPRLLTIQTLDLSGTTSVLSSGNASYTASIGATAYTTYVAPTPGSVAATGVAPAATG